MQATPGTAPPANPASRLRRRTTAFWFPSQAKFTYPEAWKWKKQQPRRRPFPLPPSRADDRIRAGSQDDAGRRRSCGGDPRNPGDDAADARPPELPARLWLGVSLQVTSPPASPMPRGRWTDGRVLPSTLPWRQTLTTGSQRRDKVGLSPGYMLKNLQHETLKTLSLFKRSKVL